MLFSISKLKKKKKTSFATSHSCINSVQIWKKKNIYLTFTCTDFMYMYTCTFTWYSSSFIPHFLLICVLPSSQVLLCTYSKEIFLLSTCRFVLGSFSYLLCYLGPFVSRSCMKTVVFWLCHILLQSMYKYMYVEKIKVSLC